MKEVCHPTIGVFILTHVDILLLVLMAVGSHSEWICGDGTVGLDKISKSVAWNAKE